MAHLEGSLRAGQRCLVVMGSRGALEKDVLDKVVARVNAWREEEEGLDAPLVVRDYTSATGDERKEDFCAIEAAWAGCDLVAYTPCVTVGSSFDLRGVFDRVYMYADARTATPRVMNQMAGRVRHPKSPVVHTFIAGGGGRGGGEDLTLEGLHEELAVKQADMVKLAASILGMPPSAQTADSLYVCPETGVWKRRMEPLEDILARSWHYLCYLWTLLEVKRARADWAGELARLCASKGYTLARSSEEPLGEAEEDGAAERKREQDDVAFHHARALGGGTDVADVRAAITTQKATAEDKLAYARWLHVRHFSKLLGDSWGTHHRHVPMAKLEMARLLRDPQTAPLSRHLFLTKDRATAPTHEEEQSVAVGAPSDYARAHHFEELCGSILKMDPMAAEGKLVASGELLAQEQRIFEVMKKYFQHAGGADNALAPNGTARTVVAAVNRVLFHFLGCKLAPAGKPVDKRRKRKRGEVGSVERSYSLVFPVLHEKRFPFTLLDVLATYEPFEE